MTSSDDDLNLLDDLVKRACGAGADAADAILATGTSLSHDLRFGKTEKLERSEGRDLGLRVFVGQRQAIASTSDTEDKALGELVERAVDMARSVPEDAYCGLAAAAELAQGEPPDLDTVDDAEPTAEALIEQARVAEDAAMAVDGVTNSEGASASWSRSRIAMRASNGFGRAYAKSYRSVGVAVLAGEGLAMERDYDYASAVYGDDLDDPAAIGRNAGERAVRRLGARKAETAQVPVVYEPRVAGSLLRHLAGAINGASIARGSSFLKDKMDQAVLPAGVTVTDDPHRKRGLRSKPFDGEGIATQRRDLVADGRLTTWLLDLATARQLKLRSTGHASRGTSSPPGPGPTNLYMQAGKDSPAELMADIKSGFYVTELIGMGVNGVTGDYSRGAAGFWIEDGKVGDPVSEVTVAGNLIEMFAHLTPADDLVFRYGTDAPTIRVDGMTVAGV